MDKKAINQNLIRMRDFGDEQSFAEIYEHTKRAVYAFIKSYNVSTADAEDLTMDTFIKVKTEVCSFKNSGSGLAWIFQIAKNITLNYKRRSSRVANFCDSEGVENITANESQTHNEVYNAIYSLEQPTKNVVILKLISGLKAKEIATIMDMPLGTVLWRYNNGIKQLQKILGEQGLE